MEKVSVVECSSYDLDEVYQGIAEALKRIGFVLPENKTVLLKPNLMSRNRPEQHSVTHFSIVDALCRMLQERNCRILIGDSSAFYQKGLTKETFRTSKMTEVAEKYGAELLPFEEEPLVRVETESSVLKEIYLPRILLEADLVINVCKLKTHSSMRLSGAVKNMFGCIPGGYKQKIHMWVDSKFELSDVILDIHRAVRPALSIMDAVISLDGGPSAIGKPVKTSRILASENAAAIDLAACRIVGYEPEEIQLLICAKKRHMIMDYDDILILGDIIPVKFQHLKKGDFEKQYNKKSLFIRHTYVEVKIQNSLCTKCSKCVAACPVGAIRWNRGNVVIEKEPCISCYHCLSVCPAEAIKVKSSPMNKLVRIFKYILKL